jgi:outer membrane lipoprotein SlyB
MHAYFDTWEGVMRSNWIRLLALPLLLAAGLGACASNGVPPGIVYTSGVPSGSGPGPSASGPYGNSPYGNSSYGNASYGGPAVPAPSQGSNYGGPVAGDSGRVVSIREVALQGAGGGGGGNGPLLGGLLGAGAGATIGAITSQTLGGGIVGAVIGLVGGAIAGTIASGNYGSAGGYGGRGIEVTVQRDDGQQMTVAQRDDGDIQLGDRVQVVQNRQGVAQVVRDTSRSRDQ